MRILLVEAYHGGSHAAWADGYARRSRHDVVLVTHEARFWKWRMQGSHLTLAAAADEALDGALPDVVVVGSMTNAAAFLGAARRFLGDAPLAVYLHESQFGYPLSPRDRPDLTYAMINWSSVAVADAAVFNSAFHRDDFFTRAERVLRSFPDHRHDRLLERAAGRTAVLPVGLDIARFRRGPAPLAGEPPLVVWNQRWEHDKDPGAFVDAIADLRADGIPLRVAVAGERFVSVPDSLRRLPGLLGDDLVWFGHAPPADYPGLLRSADVVVSTARHEFFGIAVLEAIAAGAFPVLPNRLVYPEHVPASLADVCLYDDPEGLRRLLTAALTDPSRRGRVVEFDETVSRFDWSVVAPAYDRFFAELAARYG